MLVVIDESGDPGFALGSTPYFVVAMIVFDTFADAETTAKGIAATKQTLGVRRELKFSGSNDKIRTDFLTAMRSFPFRLRTIIIDKNSIRDPEYRKNSKKFAFYAMRHLIASGHQTFVPGTIIKIDRCGDRVVRDAFAAYLRKNIPQGLLKSIKFVDSKSDLLIQLADMAAGAIARPYNAPDSKTPSLWREILAPRIDDEIILNET